MRRLFVLLGFACLGFARPAEAGLSNVYQQSGNLGIAVAAAVGGNALVAFGNFPNPVPMGATVVRATLHACDVSNTNGMSATFAGTGPLSPFSGASDGGFVTLTEFVWNVTPFVAAGPLSYSWQVNTIVPGGGQIGAVALVVIWQSGSEPYRTITVLDGMQQVGETGPETESVSFTGLPGGPTTVWLVTGYDDSTATGETVTYNGAGIGGPIDQNLGFNASLLQLSGTSTFGTNTLSITNGPAPTDHMGWMIAATSVTPVVTGTHASTWGRLKTLYR